MSIIASKTLFTPEDLLLLPDSVGYELVDGKLVERPMSLESSRIAGRIIFLLTQFLQSSPLGDVFGADASFQCFPQSPNMIRKPDVSFISSGRFKGSVLPEGHCKIAPDLAVEVLSPNDLAYDIARKVKEYLAAGVTMIWVVNPDGKEVAIHRPRGGGAAAINILTEQDTITGDEVLPGFSAPVAEFFRR